MTEVILVGAFHEAIELCELSKVKIVGIIDNKIKDNYMNYPILGSDEDLESIKNKFPNIPVIIVPDQPKVRAKIFNLLSEKGFNFHTLISPNSIISKSSKVGLGCVIQSYVNISSNTEIGKFVRINTMANVMHDNKISDFTTIAPNAVLLGNVTVGSLSYIGSNATILPGVTIGNNVVIGAGAVVTKDVADGKIFVGNPAKELVKK